MCYVINKGLFIQELHGQLNLIANAACGIAGVDRIEHNA